MHGRFTGQNLNLPMKNLLLITRPYFTCFISMHQTFRLCPVVNKNRISLTLVLLAQGCLRYYLKKLFLGQFVV